MQTESVSLAAALTIIAQRDAGTNSMLRADLTERGDAGVM